MKTWKFILKLRSNRLLAKHGTKPAIYRLRCAAFSITLSQGIIGNISFTTLLIYFYEWNFNGLRTDAFFIWCLELYVLTICSGWHVFNMKRRIVHVKDTYFVVFLEQFSCNIAKYTQQEQIRNLENSKLRPKKIEYWVKKCSWYSSWIDGHFTLHFILISDRYEQLHKQCTTWLKKK